jgi:hypothetical protein
MLSNAFSSLFRVACTKAALASSAEAKVFCPACWAEEVAGKQATKRSETAASFGTVAAQNASKLNLVLFM